MCTAFGQSLERESLGNPRLEGPNSRFRAPPRPRNWAAKPPFPKALAARALLETSPVLASLKRPAANPLLRIARHMLMGRGYTSIRPLMSFHCLHDDHLESLEPGIFLRGRLKSFVLRSSATSPFRAICSNSKPPERNAIANGITVFSIPHRYRNRFVCRGGSQDSGNTLQGRISPFDFLVGQTPVGVPRRNTSARLQPVLQPVPLCLPPS